MISVLFTYQLLLFILVCLNYHFVYIVILIMIFLVYASLPFSYEYLRTDKNNLKQCFRENSAYLLSFYCSITYFMFLLIINLLLLFTMTANVNQPLWFQLLPHFNRCTWYISDNGKLYGVPKSCWYFNVQRKLWFRHQCVSIRNKH